MEKEKSFKIINRLKSGEIVSEITLPIEITKAILSAAGQIAGVDLQNVKLGKGV